MRTLNQNSVFYAPETVPSAQADLPAYLERELFKIKVAVDLMAAGHLDETHVAPTKPRTGDIRLADGTNWNPGSGRGLYYYQNSAWNPIVSTSFYSSVGVDVADYGATGDGVTDDTTSIQNAIDYVSAQGGGIVNFGEGTFLVTGLDMPSKVRLVGKGRYVTIIKLKNSSNADVIKTTDADTLWNTGSKSGSYGWAIVSMQIDGNRANNTSGSGLKIYGFSFDLVDLLIKDCPEIGIESMWARGSPTVPDILMEAYVERVTVINCGQHGVYWGGPHDTHLNTLISVQNSQSSANTYHGIFVDEDTNYSGASTFTYAHVWGVNHNNAIRLESAGHIVNSHIEGANINLYIGISDCTVQGGLVYGVGAAADGVGDIGIKLDGVAGCHIDTRVMNCDGGLIEWAGSSTYNTVNLSGYNASGVVTVGTPSTTNDINIQFFGSATEDTFQIGRNVSQGPLIQANSSGIGFWNSFLYTDGTNFGVGTSGAPTEKVHLMGDGTVRTTIEAYAGPPTFQGKRGQGTIASKSNIADTNEVLRVEGRGYYDGTFYQTGGISFKVDGTPSASSMPGRVIFSSTPSGSNFFTERFALLPSGNVIPLTDNTYSFGVAANRWSEGYFSTLRPGDGTAKWTTGSGTPEGSLTAPVGSMYTDTSGGAGTTLYIKESGAGNTGWVAK